MSKRAVIFYTNGSCEEFDDLGWDYPTIHVVYDPDEDEHLFADLDRTKCEDWCDLRNYQVVPFEDVFEYDGDEEELKKK